MDILVPRFGEFVFALVLLVWFGGVIAFLVYAPVLLRRIATAADRIANQLVKADCAPTDSVDKVASVVAG